MFRANLEKIQNQEQQFMEELVFLFPKKYQHQETDPTKPLTEE
jgi:hypothetical protein